MGKKATAKHVDAKDLAPNWKVLQMRLKEEGIQPKDLSGTVTKAPRFTKKRPHKSAPINHKFAEEIPIVGHETERGELTKIVAIDCEYVGVGDEGRDNALARVSIVNEQGMVLYDKHVKPKERVVDYRTAVSGIRPSNLINAEKFETVQKEVHKMIEGRIVVGHALHNDFKVLALVHNRRLTRDTAKCSMMRDLVPGKPAHPSLKALALNILGIQIQQGEHDSIVDARVALRLYLNMKKKWEDEIKRFRS